MIESYWDSPRILVPDGSMRDTPPARTTATASFTASSPYSCGQKACERR